MKQILTFDFDSTIVSVEALDELAKIVFADRADKQTLAAQIAEITELGMQGKLSFKESLSRRMSLINPSTQHFEKLNTLLADSISGSFLTNRGFLIENRELIYVVSGGFHEWIDPIVESLGLLKANVRANSFLYRAGQIVGYDTQNPLANDGGKPVAVSEIASQPVVMVGDGMTDYEVRKAGLASLFVAYTEHVRRQSVVDLSDFEAHSLDELINWLRN